MLDVCVFLCHLLTCNIFYACIEEINQTNHK